MPRNLYDHGEIERSRKKPEELKGNLAY